MKRFLLTILVLLIFTSISIAQNETLLSGDIDHGGFGGLMTHFSQVNEDLGILFGGYGAWLIDHKFALGGGGMGLVNDVKFGETGDGIRYISFSYGGFYIGYLHNSGERVHFSLESFIGGGSVNLSTNGSDGDELLEDDNVFVIDPTLNAEINITHSIRFTLGLGYRLVSGIGMQNLADEDLSSPILRTSIRFGAF